MCAGLNRVSLLSLNPAAGGQIQLHDVLRDYLRSRLGSDLLRQTNAALIDVAASTLPAAPPQPGTDPALIGRRGGRGREVRTAE